MTVATTDMGVPSPQADAARTPPERVEDAPVSMEALRTLAQRHFARRIERSAARRLGQRAASRG